jgi:glycosyltransferase involved in cell wall biosynthesis
MVERQACNGFRLWTKHFERIIVVMPHGRGAAPSSWRPVSQIGPTLERLEILTVPEAYRPDQFLRAYRAGRALWRAQIPRARYLAFTLGGLFGDWGAVGAMEARAQGRPFALWTDRVESEVVRRTAASNPKVHRRIRDRLTWRPMRALEHAMLRRADLGLFHGQETYDAYAPHCGGHSELVHDIHIARADHIPEAALKEKLRAAAHGPLRIAYVGRAAAMKGPDDWIDALIALDRRGVAFEATWLGDGPEHPAMLRRIAEAGLERKVSAPGFTDDPDAVLSLLRSAHVFLFCHKTPESPRNLIEALISAAPIVGYRGAYAADLISGHGGGVLVPNGDVAALADALAQWRDAPSAAADLAAAGHTHALEHFSRDAMVHRIRQVMREGCGT